MTPTFPTDRERHTRAICYALVSLSLALAGYLVLGFGPAQTIGYGAAVYVFLCAVNHRAMFARPSPAGPRDPRDEPPLSRSGRP
jgi:hypothetical protein